MYLGLVLAGATPTVWAQAATSKQFSVKDEIERQEDLDNPPETSRKDELLTKIRDLEASYLWYNDISIDEYSHLVERVLEGYSKVGAFTISCRSVGDIKQTRGVAIKSSLVGADESLDYICDRVVIAGNGLPGKSFSFSAEKYDSGYFFKFESRAFSYDQPLVRYLYGAALELRQCSDNFEEQDLILRKTEVKVEVHNLIITTRLPRGSLDELLVFNAK